MWFFCVQKTHSLNKSKEQDKINNLKRFDMKEEKRRKRKKTCSFIDWSCVFVWKITWKKVADSWENDCEHANLLNTLLGADPLYSDFSSHPIGNSWYYFIDFVKCDLTPKRMKQLQTIPADKHHRQMTNEPILFIRIAITLT